MYAKMSFSAWISQLGSFRPTDEHGLVNRPQLPPSDCLIRLGKDGTESYRHHRLVASGHLTDQIVYTCTCVRCKLRPSDITQPGLIGQNRNMLAGRTPTYDQMTGLTQITNNR